MKVSDGPHAKRRGWLKNGNTPGDPSRAPRCGAHARQTGAPCRAPAMTNGRCRLHGGKSTGPRTPEGRANSALSNWKHGGFSFAAKEERREARSLINVVRGITKRF